MSENESLTKAQIEAAGADLSEHDYAERLRRLLTSAIASMLRSGLNHSESARLYWQTAANKYRERWAQGDLDGILPLLPQLMTWLREAGIEPARNSDVVALCNDPSFERLRGRMDPVDCNPKLLEMFRQLKESAESGPLLRR